MTKFTEDISITDLDCRFIPVRALDTDSHSGAWLRYYPATKTNRESVALMFDYMLTIRLCNIYDLDESKKNIDVLFDVNTRKFAIKPGERFTLKPNDRCKGATCQIHMTRNASIIRNAFDFNGFSNFPLSVNLLKDGFILEPQNVD